MTGWRSAGAGLLLSVALLLPWAHSSLAPTCGRRTSEEESNIVNIIGGKPADITNFPWQVSIFNNEHHICGGTILNEWWILTASHCFIKINHHHANLTIVYGTDDLSNRNLTRMTVDKVFTHPYFDSWVMNNDIALILLKSPLNLGDENVPICLSEVTNLKTWSSCWVTGWGTTNESSTEFLPSRLHQVHLELLTWDRCFNVLPVLTRNMLCANSSQEGRDACQGDSGSPLICHKKNNKTIWYQLGIVSWGISCGQKDVPGVYTKVTNYLPWIKGVTTKAGRPYVYQSDSGYSLLLSPWVILLLSFVMLLLS